MSNLDLRRIGVVAVLTCGLALAGCGKKKPPVTAPPAPPVTTQAPSEDITPAPAPDTSRDPVEAPRPASLEELTESLHQSGTLGDVFFAFDQYDLRPDARDRLERNARFFNSAEGSRLTFTIEGHCDERGTNEYNIALGQRRTSAVVDYLTSLGVDRSRFKMISYGEERPFCTQSTESCWQKNRRAHFVVSGQS